MTLDRLIRILLVDDHEVLRSGLRYLLDVVDEIEVVGEASNGFEALERCQECQPDVILMDMMMPEMDGVEATRTITAQFPDVRVIMLTSFKEEDKVQAALGAGAIGYLTKSVSAEEMTEAIIKAHAGISTLSPEATQALIHARNEPATPDVALSPRELDVLRYLISGMTNPEIADQLHISKATVKRHVSNILHKMDVNTRTEAVALALKEKIIE